MPQRKRLGSKVPPLNLSYKDRALVGQAASYLREVAKTAENEKVRATLRNWYGVLHVMMKDIRHEAKSHDEDFYL